MALPDQTPDSLDRILATDIPGRRDVPEIPAHKRGGENGAASSEFEIIDPGKVISSLGTSSSRASSA